MSKQPVVTPKYLLFDNKADCVSTLAVIKELGKKLAKSVNRTVNTKDGVERIVSVDATGTERPDSQGTIEWDVPQEAKNKEGWFFLSPYNTYPIMQDALGLEESDLPDGWSRYG